MPDPNDLQIQFADQPAQQDPGLQINFADQPQQAGHGATGSWEAESLPHKLWRGAVQNFIEQTQLAHAASSATRAAIYDVAHGGAFNPSLDMGRDVTQAWNAALTQTPQAPQVVHGAWGAVKSGYQGSATGLALRGSLPSVSLDPNGTKWWEKQIAGATQLVSDLPEMAVGFAGAGLLGLETGPGAAATGAAGAFAVPTAIREALITAYSTNQATSVSDFTNRTGVALAHTAEDAVLGAATGGAGAVVSKAVAPLAAQGTLGLVASKAAAPAAELTTLGTLGPALQGRLPEKDDFLGGAVLMLGLHGVNHGLHLARGVAEGLGNIYAKTGVTPRQVLADAQTDPTIAQDLRVAAETQQAHTEALEAAQERGVDRSNPVPPMTDAEQALEDSVKRKIMNNNEQLTPEEEAHKKWSQNRFNKLVSLTPEDAALLDPKEFDGWLNSRLGSTDIKGNHEGILAYIAKGDFFNAERLWKHLEINAPDINGEYFKSLTPDEQQAALEKYDASVKSHNEYRDKIQEAKLAAAQTDPTIAQDLRVAAAEPEAQPTQTVKEAITSEGDAALQAPEAAFQKYEADPRTAGGKIINGDLMAEVASPTVAEHPIEGHSLMAEHGAANRLANDLFEKRMAEPPASPDEAVLILVGNAGVGKSTIAERNAESYQTVLDTNSANPTGLQQSINKALNSGRKVDVLYVHAPIEEAVQRNVARQAQEGRPVRILDQADLAVQAPASFGQAHEVFGQDSNVSFSSHETVPNGQTHTGQAAADFVQGLRDQNASQNVLQKAMDAYTEATRGRNVHPDARAIFEHGLPEGSVVPPESNAGRVPAGDRAAGGGEGAAALAPGQSQVALPRAYQSAADAQAIQDAVPGYKVLPGMAESVAQELFLHPDQKIPGEPSSLQVNYKYLNTSDQVNGALARMSELNEKQIEEQRRGTVTWAQTEAEAGSYLASLLGENEPVSSRAPGTAAGAAELLARKQLVRGAALDMKAQAKALVELGTNASPDQVMDFLNSINRSAMIQAEFLGARAEAGRALNILKDTKVTAERAELIQDLISRFKQDPLKLAQMLEQTDSPEGASAFAREATKATTWQKVVEAWKAGLLGPLAVTKKALSDGVMMVSRPLVDAIAYAPSQLSADPAERMSAVEPLARIIGNVQGASEGLTQVWNEIKLESMGGVTENRAAIPGVAGELIRTPFRLLKAVTVLAKAMQERGEANALAARQASFEGYNPATAEFAEKVAQYSANPSVEASEQIEKFGNRMVFNAPLNPPGKAFQKFINTPVEGNIAPLQLVFPFTKVPLNVFDEQARLSPLAFLSKDWRTDFAQGGAERAKAAAETVVGMGLTGLGLAWAASGRISGAGDPDPNKRRIAMAAGWQPYSLKLGNTWYSMKNIHPVGTLLGLSADIHEMSQFMTEGESDRAIRTLGQAFAHSVTEQTMLQGMTMVVEALNAPERGVQHLVQSYAASAVPATVAQTASTMDPYMREVNSIRDAIQNRIPGLREDLEPKRDPYGEPIPNPERLGVTLPITKAEESTDKVRTEAARLGIGVAKAPQAINLPTRGLLHGQETKVQMTPEQRDTFASTAGRMAYSIMSPLVHSPDWDQTPDILKAKIYSVAFEKANKIGNAAALSQAQRQQEMQRITDEISSKLHAPVAP